MCLLTVSVPSFGGLQLPAHSAQSQINKQGCCPAIEAGIGVEEYILPSHMTFSLEIYDPGLLNRTYYPIPT